MELINNNTNEHPTRKEVRNGKQLLADAVKSGKLTNHDIAYIKCATDPWHDTSIDDFVGIPDTFNGKSVTEVLTTTVDIKTPYAQGSGNYSCRIYNSPFLGGNQLIRSTAYGPTVTQPVAVPGNTINVANVVIDYSATSNFSDYPVHTTVLPIDQANLIGSVKIAGMGIEVVNTTAELYKQGMLSVARLPQPLSSNTMCFCTYGSTVSSNATWIPYPMEVIPIISPPTTLSELTTYPDYKQWEAKEGMYAVVRQYNNLSHSPAGWKSIARFIDHEPVGSTSSVYTQTNIDTSWLKNTSPGSSGAPLNTWMPDTGVITAPMDTVVAFLTGLSESTTLTVKVKYYVERRVNTSINELRALVPFTKDSPPINPLALELVSTLWSILPPAVMFKENPAGEWWDRVLGGIAEIAPSVLGMIPHPIAKAAAVGLPMAINAFRGERKQESSEEKLARENAELRKMIEEMRKRDLVAKQMTANSQIRVNAARLRGEAPRPQNVSKKTVPPKRK